MDGVDGGEVVVFDFAEFEEAVEERVSMWLVDGDRREENRLFAHLGRVIDQKVNHNVAGAGLEEDRHGGSCGVEARRV